MKIIKKIIVSIHLIKTKSSKPPSENNDYNYKNNYNNNNINKIKINYSKKNFLNLKMKMNI